jgi:hypothetical protein
VVTKAQPSLVSVLLPCGNGGYLRILLGHSRDDGNARFTCTDFPAPRLINVNAAVALLDDGAQGRLDARNMAFRDGRMQYVANHL